MAALKAAVSPAVQASALLELRRRRRLRIESQGLSEPIPAGMSFLAWCEKLGADGMKVDGKPFRLDNRAALVPLYEAIPSTREEAAGKVLVVQKATQLGLTVWEVLANIYMALKWGPITIGMFLPDQSTASYKSEHRFMRIVRSVPDLYQALTMAERDGDAKKVGEGNVLTRAMGESLFLFLWTSGRVSTESRPMDVVTLDEVQEMELDQIDKVRARTGDSDISYTLMLSTANMPDLDINFWFQQGTQEVWMTRCPHCAQLSDLSDPAGNFPAKSIAYNSGQFPDRPLNEYYWACPSCAGVIDDPQVGEVVVVNPAAASASTSIRSILLPRTISPRMTPRAMAESWARAKTGNQRKSFYNRTLARPYVDADQLPVTLAVCEEAARIGMAAGLVWESSGRDCFMGIDQMGSFNAVIIKRRLPDGRQAVVHVEAVFDLDPFERCSVLMGQYGVVVCVVEQLPNVNDARKFANRHRGRVFLAGYADLKEDALHWGDSLSRSDARTTEEDRTRYTVTLNQYKCMQASLYRVRDRACLFPDPAALEQDVLDAGVTRRIPILRDWVFVHFTKTALVIDDDAETRCPRGRVQKIGIDPHYSFANMLCDVAWARAHGTTSFFFPQGAPEGSGPQQAAREGLRGVPDQVIRLMDEAPRDASSCGRCESFDRHAGMCREHGFLVTESDPACDMFLGRGEG